MDEQAHRSWGTFILCFLWVLRVIVDAPMQCQVHANLRSVCPYVSIRPSINFHLSGDLRSFTAFSQSGLSVD